MCCARRWLLLTISFSILVACASEPTHPKQPPRPKTWPITAQGILRDTTYIGSDPLPEPPEVSIEQLLEEGAHFASTHNMPEALARWRWALIALIPQWRGLEYQYPVSAAFMTRDSLGLRLAQELESALPEKQLDHITRLGELLGFYPEGFRLRELLLSLYLDEVAGFYDPNVKELFLVEDAPSPAKTILDLVSPGSAAQQQYVILAHELQHALADQHFDLHSMQAVAKTDDDMSLALSALIEGDAMVVMTLPALPSRDRLPFLTKQNRILNQILQWVTPVAAQFSAGDAYSHAPGIIQASMLWPYVQGMSFVMHLTRASRATRLRDAFAGVDAAYKRPPISTEQILHPEKYLKEYDNPVTLSWESPPLPLRQYTQLYSNTVGEFQLGILLKSRMSETAALAAAEGWDGDTIQLLQASGKPTALWAIEMDTVQDAEELQSALLEHLQSDNRKIAFSLVKSSRRIGISIGMTINRQHFLEWVDGIQSTPKGFAMKKTPARMEYPEQPDNGILQFQQTNISTASHSLPAETARITELKRLSSHIADEGCRCKTKKCIGLFAKRLRDEITQAQSSGLAFPEDVNTQFLLDTARLQDCLTKSQSQEAP